MNDWMKGPFIVTDKHCKASWGGVPNGKLFRCAICGHKFTPGDDALWVYTNYPGSKIPGNPFVCIVCADTKEKAIEILLKMREEAKCYWWFAHLIQK